MKKLIVDVVGKENKMMEFEEVLNKYGNLLHKFAKRITIPGYSYDDILQECQIALWEAFKTYDEKNAFIVHANWTLKYKLSNLIKYMTSTQKRGNEHDFLLSLDYEDGSEDNKSLADTIQSDINIEEDFENKALLGALSDLMKDDIDRIVFQVLLGNIKNGQASAITGVSKQLITNRARRMKDKLGVALVSFNPENIKYLR